MVIVGRRRKVRQARRRIVGRHHYGFILKIDILSCIRDTLFVPSKQRGPFLLSTTGSAPYVPTRSINDEECALIREARFFFIPPLRHVVCGRRHRIKYLINIPLPPHIHTHTHPVTTTNRMEINQLINVRAPIFLLRSARTR